MASPRERSMSSGKPYYQDDYVTIYHGDCRDILPSLPQVDLVLTDPPYASGARRDADRQTVRASTRAENGDDWFSHDTMTTWGFSWFLRSVLTELKPRMSEGAHLYLFTDWRQTPNVYGMLEATGYRVNHCLVWDKQHYGMGAYWRNQHENIVFASVGQPREMLRHDLGTVIRCPTVNQAVRIHPTEKPLTLIGTILDASPGEVILDMFAGSGPTLFAAKKRNRKCIGIEIEERFCEVAANRCRQMVMNLST